MNQRGEVVGRNARWWYSGSFAPGRPQRPTLTSCRQGARTDTTRPRKTRSGGFAAAAASEERGSGTTRSSCAVRHLPRLGWAAPTLAVPDRCHSASYLAPQAQRGATHVILSGLGDGKASRTRPLPLRARRGATSSSTGWKTEELSRCASAPPYASTMRSHTSHPLRIGRPGAQQKSPLSSSYPLSLSRKVFC